MNTRAQGFLLLLLGGALVRLGSSDLLLRYVRAAAGTWVLLAGCTLLVLAAAALILSYRRPAEPAARTGWLLSAPVVVILLIAPPALGAFTAGRASMAPAGRSRPARGGFPQLIGAVPYQLSLLDFSTRALWDAGRTLNGRDVELTGFVLRLKAGGFVLARLVISCCAADARPVEVMIDGAPPSTTGGWVRVTGRYAGTGTAPLHLAILHAATQVAVRQPTDPYD